MITKTKDLYSIDWQFPDIGKTITNNISNNTFNKQYV